MMFVTTFVLVVTWGSILCAQQAEADKKSDRPTTSTNGKTTRQAEANKKSDKKAQTKMQIEQQTPPPTERRSKVCYVSITPPVSCVSAVTHKVGESCACKQGEQTLEGRYLDLE
jgi:hypothetical protein